MAMVCMNHNITSTWPWCHVNWVTVNDVSWQRSVRRNASTESVFELDLTSTASETVADDTLLRPGDGVILDKGGRVVGTVTVHAPSGRRLGVFVNEEGDHWGLVRLFCEEASLHVGGKTVWGGGGDDWGLEGMFDDTEYEARNAGGDRGDVA